MSLDESREFVLTIDSRRSLSAVPTEDGATVCLTMEDPHSLTCVELTLSELKEFRDALTELLTE